MSGSCCATGPGQDFASGTNGMPTRSDAEVAAIFATHCQPCEHYDPAAQTCAVCGCRVRQSGAALLNKIKMATERCPKGRW